MAREQGQKMGLTSRHVLVGVVGLLGAILAVGIVWTVKLVDQPEGPAYGPASAAELRLILAPGIRAELLPSHRLLKGSRFDEFDISPEGGIGVRVGSGVFDMTSGRRLVRAADGVASFAFLGGSLVAVTESWQLAYLSDDGLKAAAPSPIRPARITAARGGGRLLIFKSPQHSAPNETRGWLLYSLSAAGKGELLAGSPEPVLAVAGDEVSTYFSVGGSLFALAEPGRPVLVLDLPDRADRIVGIAVSGLTVYFSTQRAVSVLRNNLVLPVVIGLGGQLRLTADGLYVLDAKQGQLYRIVVDEPQTPAAAGRSRAEGPEPIQMSSRRNRRNP